MFTTVTHYFRKFLSAQMGQLEKYTYKAMQTTAHESRLTPYIQ